MSHGAVAEDPIVAALEAYAQHHRDERQTVDQFIALAGDAHDPYVRERLAGHFTGSAWLVDRTGTRVLLTHHRKLDRWLQLGGHADGDRDLARVARREAEEESGLTELHADAVIFDIDRHRIPEHKGVPEHWHYDVRYVVHAGADETFVVSAESNALAWWDIATLAEDAAADASLQRMARRWRSRGVSAGSVEAVGSVASGT